MRGPRLSSSSPSLLAAPARRWALLAVSALAVLYVTACCAYYVRSLTIFGGGALLSTLRGGGTAASDSASPSPLPLTEEEQKLAVRAELGHGMWNMLHRMAAQYDKEPTAKRKGDMVEFFRLLGEFYPCPECAAHFRDMLRENPVEADDNRGLSLWLCRVHNIVNRRLGKPEFTCTLDALKERWGSCGCFDNEEEEEGGKEEEEGKGKKKKKGEGAREEDSVAEDVRKAWSA
jgi:FAD-linked sulfhydryl oxidase